MEEPYRLTPQLAFRIGILGAFALAAFALLFLRLWALQVLSGEDYLRAARDNQLRQVRVEAARGQIVDRRGRVLVDNRTVTSIRIWPSNLPDKGRYAEMQRLARVLGVPLSDVLAKLQQQKLDPLTPITIKNNVPDGRGHVPLRAPDGLPGREDRGDAGAPLSLGRARAARPSATSARSPRIS